VVCTKYDVRILVSNDDGIYSPGIAALAEAASTFGSVQIVAPDVERSSTGHAITATYPVSYRPTRIGDFAAFRVNGTPADCVALGAHLWGSVDLVLSGLNLGFNLGNSIWHSGTLAAAKQAALLGLRGIALSIPAGADQDLGALTPWVERLLQTLLDEPALPLVNVNLPRAPRGMLWTRASVRQYDGRVVPTKDPQGRDLYWFTVVPLEGAEEGTDRWAIEQNWISLTPLRLDLTDEAQLRAVAERRPLDRDLALATSSRTSSAQAAEAVRAEESASPATGSAPTLSST
jgi:5'-nucleotidase